MMACGRAAARMMHEEDGGSGITRRRCHFQTQSRYCPKLLCVYVYCINRNTADENESRRQQLQCAPLLVEAQLDGKETRKGGQEKIMPVMVAPLECHPGHHPRHGHRQSSSPAANLHPWQALDKQ